MKQLILDPLARIRILECWLPLAQEINNTEGWDCYPPTLEVLILVALPSLRDARSAAESGAVLRHVYRLYLGTWL